MSDQGLFNICVLTGTTVLTANIETTVTFRTLAVPHQVIHYLLLLQLMLADFGLLLPAPNCCPCSNYCLLCASRVCLL